MKRLALAACVIGLLGLHSTSASATSIQPAVWSGNGTNVGSGSTSQTSAGTGFVTYDNFSFATATTINQLTWLGIYVNDTTFLNGAPNTSRWDILIFDSTGIGGTPANLIGGAIDDKQVTRTTLGTGLFGANTVTVYQFTALFPDFNAGAGVGYWFAPVSVGPSFEPVFSWIQGTGGNGLALQAQIAGFVFVPPLNVRDGDRAFSLSSVPEPSTLALLALGLGGVAVGRRRRRS